jgi:hypothetical protein
MNNTQPQVKLQIRFMKIYELFNFSAYLDYWVCNVIFVLDTMISTTLFFFFLIFNISTYENKLSL